MSRLGDLYRELRQRRVIRTAVVYAALVWGALQVADLLAGADFLSERSVRWMILVALVGFPVTLILSWFFETPWRERRGLSVLGDIAVIVAVAIGVSLLAWQQYFTSFARPTLAILPIEPTDTRADTGALGDYLASRLRAALSLQPELAVTELGSSLHPSLRDIGIAERAQRLQADLLLTGTLNQGAGETLRLNLQLFNAEAELAWSSQFDHHIEELAQLEGNALTGLWAALPLPPDTLAGARQTWMRCRYPAESEAIRTLVQADQQLLGPAESVQQLSGLIEHHASSGLLRLARARAFFRQRDAAPPARQPVYHNLGLQDLDHFEALCPGNRAARLERLRQNRAALATIDEFKAFLADYPNDASTLLGLAGAWLEEDKADKAMATARSAWELDPLNWDTACAVSVLYRDAGQAALGDDLVERMAEASGSATVPCTDRQALQ